MKFVYFSFLHDLIQIFFLTDLRNQKIHIFIEGGRLVHSIAVFLKCGLQEIFADL